MKKQTKNQSWINKHPVWFALFCIIGFFLLIGIFASLGNSDNLNTETNCKITEQKLENLENGFIQSCELNKLNAKSTLLTINMLETLGYYEASKYKNTFEEVSNWNCYELMNTWENRK